MAATAFYLAHQGLNDREVKELLYELHATLCPELVYIVPYLQKFQEERAYQSVSEKGNTATVPTTTGGTSITDDNIVSMHYKKVIKIGLISSYFF